MPKENILHFEVVVGTARVVGEGAGERFGTRDRSTGMRLEGEKPEGGRLEGERPEGEKLEGMRLDGEGLEGER